MLDTRLIPRLIRESRKFTGHRSRSKPTARELELLMGLHGGIFYIGMRRWVYGHAAADGDSPVVDATYIGDRVGSYLLSLEQILQPATKPLDGPLRGVNGSTTQERSSASRRNITRSKSALKKDTHSWPTH
jgi:hypothetical protein